MKKKALFVLVGVLCTAVLCSQQDEGDIRYIGQNCGQKTYDNEIIRLKREQHFSIITPGATKLPKGSWEIVNHLLTKYDTSRGDTFSLHWYWYDDYTHYFFVCEFTSDTEYTYWCVTARWL